MPAWQRIVGRDVSCDERCDAHADTAAAHFRQRHGTLAAIRLVALVPLTRTDLFDRAREVPIPLERVHREIEVSVNNEHGSTTLRERDEPRSRGEAYSMDTSRLTTKSRSNTRSHASSFQLSGAAGGRPRRRGPDARAQCAGACSRAGGPSSTAAAARGAGPPAR